MFLSSSYPAQSIPIDQTELDFHLKVASVLPQSAQNHPESFASVPKPDIIHGIKGVGDSICEGSRKETCKIQNISKTR